MATPVQRWQLERLDGLCARDVHDILTLRSAVFVVEQHCVFQDPDKADYQSWHLLGRDRTDALVAYLRIVDPGAKYSEVSIGRVVTDAAIRRSGCGIALMQEGIARAQRLWPQQAIRIGAQWRLTDFYRRFGFENTGEIYIEDGIRHIEMMRAPPEVA